MPHTNRYFIEYRVCGKLRLELLSVQNELVERFPDFSKFDEQIPHITLIPPINSEIAKEFILESIREELKPVQILEFEVKNYGFFDNEDTKPIFVNIEFDENLRKIRERLINRLRKRVEVIDRFEDQGYNPHIALGFTENKKTADKIARFLSKEHPLNMKQIFDRISILNGNKILWEYDIFNRRVLNRTEALHHNERLRNIYKIIEIKTRTAQKTKLKTTSSPNKIEKHKRLKREKTLWVKFKSLFH